MWSYYAWYCAFKFVWHLLSFKIIRVWMIWVVLLWGGLCSYCSLFARQFSLHMLRVRISVSRSSCTFRASVAAWTGTGRERRGRERRGVFAAVLKTPPVKAERARGGISYFCCRFFFFPVSFFFAWHYCALILPGAWYKLPHLLNDFRSWITRIWDFSYYFFVL